MLLWTTFSRLKLVYTLFITEKQVLDHPHFDSVGTNDNSLSVNHYTKLY